MFGPSNKCCKILSSQLWFPLPYSRPNQWHLSGLKLMHYSAEFTLFLILKSYHSPSRNRDSCRIRHVLTWKQIKNPSVRSNDLSTFNAILNFCNTITLGKVRCCPHKARDTLNKIHCINKLVETVKVVWPSEIESMKYFWNPASKTSFTTEVLVRVWFKANNSEYAVKQIRFP